MRRHDSVISSINVEDIIVLLLFIWLDFCLSWERVCLICEWILFFIFWKHNSTIVVGKLERMYESKWCKLWRGAEDGRLYGQQKRYSNPRPLSKKRKIEPILWPLRFCNCLHRQYKRYLWRYGISAQYTYCLNGVVICLLGKNQRAS